LASSQSWLPLLRPSIPIGWRLRLLRENFTQQTFRLKRSSGNHDWLLANASDCVWMETGLHSVYDCKCSVLRGQSSTLGRCSKHCRTCCVSATVATHRSVSLTSGWPSSACSPELLSMRCSSVNPRHWSSRLTLPSACTQRRYTSISYSRYTSLYIKESNL